MRGPHNIWRLIRTGATLERTGAMGVVLEAFNAPVAVRIAARTAGWPFKWLGYRGDPNLPPLLRALQAMGPAYVKLGQILSTRPDVVGEDLSRQLKILQDRMPPFPRAVAIASVEKELGIEIDAVFSDFSEPIAAASIAQVHRARLRETGQEVAVKVLRPNIERDFRRDFDAFYLGATIIETLAPASRRLHPRAVIEHFHGSVRGELDLRLESASASEYEASTKEDEGFWVPKMHWKLSDRRVMTLDWAEGPSCNELEAIDAAGHDRKVLGERILGLFLKHALHNGFFHADMHQGNLKIAANGDIIALDFGIMGRLDEYTRRVYAEIIYGFIQKDYRRVAEVHFEAGYVPADRDIDEFASALRVVGEPIFGMSAGEISMGRVLSYLFEVTERFGMETRMELIHLQRTMVVVEGVARSLYPNINMWDVARPVVEDYIKKSIGPRAFLRDLSRTVRILSHIAPRLPEIAQDQLARQARVSAPPAEDDRGGKRWLWFAAGAAFAGAVAFGITLI
ncbi:2-polyprenylphenol 6-hydroxylase [Tropicimonas sp. IMCC6043]|uniref:2-polyprenylphenol 6-hydroxylase n=1 Tax=Tropicimonas sp. IMCC6043 TaxID=2510645 RepID=UPI00101DB15F|nr:2-polyprenylphenol 6-hydroxylase [Tropicimonas sp. IMCC6043]RYH09210.1 2-polyprenylphenol 6-hydroxylase [Tropicimonas sp. IMCC6043]